MTDWNNPAELFAHIDSQARSQPQAPDESKQEAIRCGHPFCNREIVSKSMLYSPLLQQAYCGDYCMFMNLTVLALKSGVPPVLPMMQIDLEMAKVLKQEGML